MSPVFLVISSVTGVTKIKKDYLEQLFATLLNETPRCEGKPLFHLELVTGWRYWMKCLKNISRVRIRLSVHGKRCIQLPRS